MKNFFVNAATPPDMIDEMFDVTTLDGAEMAEDEFPLELDTFYEYDPETYLFVGETGLKLPEGKEMPINHTTTPPGDYNPHLEIPTYDANGDKWNIVPIDEPLKDYKIYSKARIDIEIKGVVRRNITIGAQTAGLYTIKYDEAIKYKEAGYPDNLTDYPFLSTEAPIRNAPARDIADTIISKHDEWNDKLKNLEIIRLQAKADIDAVSVTTSTDNSVAKLDKIVESAVAEISKL